MPVQDSEMIKEILTVTLDFPLYQELIIIIFTFLSGYVYGNMK